MQGLRISQHRFFNTKICDRTAELDMHNCYEEYYRFKAAAIGIVLQKNRNSFVRLRNSIAFAKSSFSEALRSDFIIFRGEKSLF